MSKPRTKGQPRSNSLTGASKDIVNQPILVESEISKNPANLGRVKENIRNMVGNSAENIVEQLIRCALNGEVAPAKYLLEMTRLGGGGVENDDRPREDSLAYTLLKHFGLPTEPVAEGEDCGALERLD